MVNNTLGNLKVLIAEDNEINKLIAKTMLQKWGFSIVMAADGVEAVKQVEENNFDIILMDIQMPNKDGLEATNDIRAMENDDKKNIPIIALTANTQVSMKEKYDAAGMNGYLNKPFKEVDLYEMIEKVLHKIN
jgi:CheY-like chemotaxis protein